MSQVSVKMNFFFVISSIFQVPQAAKLKREDVPCDVQYRQYVIQGLSLTRLRHCDWRIEPKDRSEILGDLELTFESGMLEKVTDKKSKNIPTNLHEITSVSTKCKTILLVEKRCLVNELKFMKEKLNIYAAGSLDTTTHHFIKMIQQQNSGINVEILSDFDKGGMHFAQHALKWIPNSRYIGVSPQQIQSQLQDAKKKAITELKKLKKSELAKFRSDQKRELSLQPVKYWNDYLKQVHMTQTVDANGKRIQGGITLNIVHNLKEALAIPTGFSEPKKPQKPNPNRKNASEPQSEPKKRKSNSEPQTKPQKLQKVENGSPQEQPNQGQRQRQQTNFVFQESDQLADYDLEELLSDPTIFLSNAHVDIACRIALDETNTQYDYLPCEVICNFFQPMFREWGERPFRFFNGDEPEDDRLTIVFQKDLVVAIPLCYGRHWTVSIVDNRCNTVTHYDSMKIPGRANLTMEFLEALAVRLNLPLPNYAQAENYDEQQTDGHSCGLFVIERVRSIFQGRQFSRANISRSHIVDTIRAARVRSDFAGRPSVKYNPRTIIQKQ
jgi:5S rRNA maturation endonuclease (ribonuclease M5)